MNDLEQFTADNELLQSTEIAERYPNRFVAAFQGQLVAIATEMDLLLETLREQGIPSAYTAVAFITTEPIDPWRDRPVQPIPAINQKVFSLADLPEDVLAALLTMEHGRGARP